jgi:hypothetical protein
MPSSSSLPSYVIEPVEAEAKQAVHEATELLHGQQFFVVVCD